MSEAAKDIRAVHDRECRCSARGPCSVASLLARQDELAELLDHFLPPHSGMCATVSCGCSSERKRADELLGIDPPDVRYYGA